ncbi:MAG: hypothetical protein NTX86_04965 [Candidatus Dependentiae bacterium]|nr:hypothetical protein [Candidatus Dependentiae bacterium]
MKNKNNIMALALSGMVMMSGQLMYAQQEEVSNLTRGTRMLNKAIPLVIQVLNVVKSFDKNISIIKNNIDDKDLTPKKIFKLVVTMTLLVNDLNSTLKSLFEFTGEAPIVKLRNLSAVAVFRLAQIEAIFKTITSNLKDVLELVEAIDPEPVPAKAQELQKKIEKIEKDPEAIMDEEEPVFED